MITGSNAALMVSSMVIFLVLSRKYSL